jgi:hypothetical protein
MPAGARPNQPAGELETSPVSLPQPDKVHIQESDLVALGLTAADVRRRCYWATEYVALDGGPCWRAEELDGLLDGGEML